MTLGRAEREQGVGDGHGVLTEQGDRREWIPNIDLGEDYDKRYRGASIHYDVLRNLAEHFGRKMPVHRHAQSYQLHLIENGQVRFHIEDQLFEVTGPCLFFTPAAIPHSFETQADATGHVLTLSQSLVWALAKRAGDPDLDRGLSHYRCLTAEAMGRSRMTEWQLIRDLMSSIRREWQGNDIAKPFVLENLVALLLTQVARLSQQGEASLDANNEELRLFNRFVRTIEAHYREHWTIPAYTRAVGLSERRLNEICKRISHATPKQLIRERLINEAKRLLTFTQRCSNDIAYDLGFSDPAYFSRFFRRQTGSSPLAYRESSRHGQQ